MFNVLDERMKKFLILVCAISILFFAKCGGGGGEYYPPKIVLNKIGLHKVEIKSSEINEYNKLVLEGYDQLEKIERTIAGTKYYYFKKFQFMGQQYEIAIPINNWVSIIDNNNKVLKKLETPRYTRNAAAIELKGKDGKSFMAIYIDQQSSSHSSTLFILSDELDLGYKEHLLGAKWMAKETSESGENLIISCEKKWLQNDEWVIVGGPWRYIL